MLVFSNQSYRVTHSKKVFKMFEEIDALKKKLPLDKNNKPLIFNSFYDVGHFSHILDFFQNINPNDSNHYRGVDMFLISDFAKNEISETSIKQFQDYRKVNSYLEGFQLNCDSGVIFHKFPNFEEIPDLMKEFIDTLNTKNFSHPIEKASFFHMNFINIHPFFDENGRTARFFTNVILYNGGFLPIRPTTISKIRYQLLFSGATFDHSLEDSHNDNKLDYLRSVFKSQKTGDNSFFTEYLINIQRHEILSYLNHRNCKISC